MNVKELKERLKDLPDDMLICVPGPDDTYDMAFCEVRPVEPVDQYLFDADKGSDEIHDVLVVL